MQNLPGSPCLDIESVARGNISAIVGSPGSGKTEALISKVAQLEEDFEPEQILVLAPSRLAASSLRDAISMQSKKVSTSSRAKSFSAFAFERLRSANPDLALLSGPQQHQLLQQLIGELEERHKTWGINLKSLPLRAFVQELRDLLQVAIEFELDEAKLIGLQTKFPKLKLQVLIDLLPAYKSRLHQMQRLDASALLVNASKLPSPEGLAWVLVDDAQDLAPAALELISKFSTTANVILYGDPDAAVQGFRSAEPGAFLKLASSISFLDEIQRSASVSPLLAKTASKLPPAGAGRQRSALSVPHEVVTAPVFSSTTSESDYLAAKIRRTRLEQNLNFSDFAVVLRTKSQLDQLARDLSARNVPVQIIGSGQATSSNPLSRAMLEIAQLALKGDLPQLLREVLGSSFIGLSSIQLRRLERLMVHHFEVPSSVAWPMALENGIEAEGQEARALNEIVGLIRDIRSREFSKSHELISRIWQLAPSQLRSLALGHGEVATAANRDLDAALKLFEAAIRADEQGLAPKDFIDQEMSVSIEEDSLAKRSSVDAVALTTSSSLAGREFRYVALPRLQDGIWPNLKPRNSLLGAASLRAFLSGTSDDPTAAVRGELAAELRLLFKALGAAKDAIWLSSMRSGEEQPSQFFTMLGVELVDHDEPVDFDLRRYVGRLRARLATGDLQAAGLLAGFALAGVPGAHPRNWQGLLPRSSSEPLFGSGQPIPLSASSLQAFETCPLHWFIKTFAVGESSFQASVGTLVHAAFELASSASDISNFVESNWHTLEFEHQWQSNAQKRKAATMAMLAGEYLSQNPNPEAIEKGFELEIGRLRIRGKIDRIERSAEGLIIADLKTGKTGLEAKDNLQLAVYQLAVASIYPDERVLGAQLVSVGMQKLKVSNQPPLSDADKNRLEEIFERFEQGAQAEYVLANDSDHCSADGRCTLLLAKQVIDG